MPPSFFKHQSQECYVRAYQQQDGVDKRRNDNTRTRSSLTMNVPDRFVRDWTWSRKWPLATIAEECDIGMQATLTYSTRLECKLTTSQVKKKKVVSFSSCVDWCHPILHVDNMTEQQKIDVWWSLNDLVMMRKMIGITLRRAKVRGCLEDDEGFCTRGIEAMSTKASQQRTERRRIALETVLNCQQQQKCKTTGYVDSEYVAQVYAAFCEPDKIMSIVVAASDAANATAILLAEP